MTPSSFFRNLLALTCVTTCMYSPSAYTLETEEEVEARQVPTDFVRDVMQPIGVPVVTTFHLLRENLFLNAKVSDGHSLEAIGDFFLVPSRYIFAGKTLRHPQENPEEYKASQSFHYENHNGVKTLLSLITLPVSQILGSTFKGLAYLSPEVRKRHQKIKKALVAPGVRSHLEEYARKGIANLHADNYIPCQGHKRPIGLTKKQKVEIKAMKEVVKILDENNIVYWIDCGTCLGAYRYGGIIPWDWDVDLSILLPDHDNVKQLLGKLDPKKYQIQDWSSYSKPKTFLKLYVKETKNFIDIYHYDFNEEDKTLAYLFTYADTSMPESWKAIELKCTKPLKYDQIFPLRKAQFDGVTVWAPNEVVPFLQSKYGENLDPTMLWDEDSKSYLKAEGHPYWET